MSDNQPLFQDTDATEREQAPEQVPGTAEHAALQEEGVPYVPVRGDTSQNQPVPLPTLTDTTSATKGGEHNHTLLE